MTDPDDVQLSSTSSQCGLWAERTNISRHCQRRSWTDIDERAYHRVQDTSMHYLVGHKTVMRTVQQPKDRWSGFMKQSEKNS